MEYIQLQLPVIELALTTRTLDRDYSPFIYHCTPEPTNENDCEIREDALHPCYRC